MNDAIQQYELMGRMYLQPSPFMSDFIFQCRRPNPQLSASLASALALSYSHSSYLVKFLWFVCFLKRVLCSPSWLSPDSLASASQVPALQACTTFPVLFLNSLNIWNEVYYLIIKSHRCSSLHDQSCRVERQGPTPASRSHFAPRAIIWLILCHPFCLFGSPH